MPAVTVSLKVKPFRLMKKLDAAHYCCRDIKMFDADCPVRPVIMPNGDKLWDVHDLDDWIEELRDGRQPTDDEILARLR